MVVKVLCSGGSILRVSAGFRDMVVSTGCG